MVSLFGIKQLTFHACISLLFTGITEIVGIYIWGTPTAIYTLWFLMLLDYFTGIAKAICNKEFVSFKLWRMPLYFISTTLLLSLAFWMAKANFLFVVLPPMVMGGFLSVYFVSLLENLGELELLPKPLIEALKSKFGLKALLEKHNDKKVKSK